ncbi:hypothetical protein C8R43DRAFT_634617 [Mycena crocata]|nr:hypothetical protein C8R43DRAFT_634617 [Mycena crocata]
MPGGSGQYHEPRNGKPSILRADTPFTSPPLDDDFDAITQRWSKTTRVTTVEPTSSGLYDQLEAVTRATTPAVPGFTKPRRRKQTSDEGDWVSRRHQTENLGGGVSKGKSLRRMKATDRIKGGHVRTGPLAGQDYEIVECQVLEEGPERTVTISTWREQAIQEADSDDEMSVYYVNAEQAEMDSRAEFVSLPRRMKESLSNSGQRSKESGESSGQQGKASDRLTSSNGQPSTSLRNAGTKTYGPGPKETSPSLHSSAPRTSTPRGSGTLVVQNIEGQVDTVKKSDPFHATTKTGSTISSIHLIPTPTLEQVLVSCRPSLIHISPVLQRIGIIGTEHLRAVGKLSEDTRNREVREEVLKLGITVMEWAILLDKLQSL